MAHGRRPGDADGRDRPGHQHRDGERDDRGDEDLAELARGPSEIEREADQHRIERSEDPDGPGVVGDAHREGGAQFLNFQSTASIAIGSDLIISSRAFKSQSGSFHTYCLSSFGTGPVLPSAFLKTKVIILKFSAFSRF